MNDLGAQPLSGEPAARVLVAGASGFTGALAAQIVWRHPRLRLAAVTSRSDAGKRLDALYPRYRVPIELTELDLDRLEGSTPRSSPTRTAPPRRPSPPCAPGASSSSTSRPTSGCATSTTYERWYGEHGAPELFGNGVYGLTEMYREELREAKLVATPGCYPTASVLGLAPLAEKGLLAEVVDLRDAGHLRLRP